MESKEGPSRYITGTKSHRIYLPICVLIIAIYVIYIIIIITGSNELVPLIPGDAVIDAIILLVILPLLGYLLLIFTPLIAMVYYILFKKASGDSKIFYLDMRVQIGKWTPKDIAKRAAIPGLLICSVAQVLVNIFGLGNWVPENFAENYQMVLALYNSAFFAYLAVILLIAPIWLLFDAGVMGKTAPEKVLERRIPETVEPISRFYIGLFKGFAGIAFITSMITMIIQIILQTISLLLMIFVLMLPFLGIALIIPVQAVYEKFLPRMTRFIHKKSMLHKAKLSLMNAEECPACNYKIKR